MSAPQHPNQPPSGPFGAPEPTIAPLWEEKRQTWSDKVVDTVVVVAPKPGQGYQAPQQYGQMPRQW